MNAISPTRKLKISVSITREQYLNLKADSRISGLGQSELIRQALEQRFADLSDRLAAENDRLAESVKRWNRLKKENA
jgi:hypothetical protein